MRKNLFRLKSSCTTPVSLFVYSDCHEGHRHLPYFLLIVSIITNSQLSRMKSLAVFNWRDIIRRFPERAGNSRKSGFAKIATTWYRNFISSPLVPVLCNVESCELSTQSGMFLPAGRRRENGPLQKQQAHISLYTPPWCPSRHYGMASQRSNPSRSAFEKDLAGPLR